VYWIFVVLADGEIARCLLWECDD